MDVRRALALGGTVALLASGCQQGGDGNPAAPSPTASSPDIAGADDCTELAVVLVDELQRHVDAFAGVLAEDVGMVSARRQPVLDETRATLRDRADELGCDATTMSPLVDRELERLRADGPVQEAIAATFRADASGSLDPSDPAPRTVTVGSARELPSVLARLGSGSTVQLTAATYELEQPLVLLRPVSIVGVGPDQTVLRSRAGAATVVLAADGDVTLRDLTVEHVGDEAASVVVVTAGGYDLRDVTIRCGRADAAGAGGFGLVLRPDPSLLVPGSLQRVSGARLEGHESGGIVVGRDQAPTVTDVAVRGDGCGLCWVEQAGGRIDGAVVEGGEAGLRVEGDAAPEVRGLHVRGAATGIVVLGSDSPKVVAARIDDPSVGVTVGGDGTPTFDEVRVTGATDVGVRLGGTSRAVFRDLTVGGDADAGVAVAEEAAPTLTGGEIRVRGEVGLLWTGTAAGEVSGFTVRASRVGIQLGGSSAPVFSRLTVTGVGDAVLFATETSAGEVEGLTCDGTASAQVVLLDRSTTRVSDLRSCRLADER
jgi:hypothetical protein